MKPWYYDAPPSPRREAKGGIKAKSQRGGIGETWWSRRFVSVLESFDMGARLTRGRAYARSGQVMDLKVRSGQVTAKVQGSRATPYKVTIRIPAFSEAEWISVQEAMAGQAIFLAQLLAGDMPHGIEEAFGAARLSLFPKGTRELETDCSCPDWANPCKHIAATYYILAEAFDRDPWLIFQWRGRSREQLQERLAGYRQAEAPASPESIPGRPVEDLSVHGFWARGEVPRPVPSTDSRWDVLLRQLGPAQVPLGGRGFEAVLAEILETAAREAHSLVLS
ncbi:MAG TPA: SWIM zinc finger family protein [Holophaga sp.]|nr:SWIM zinc finger family protein [Holophaga sp.]